MLTSRINHVAEYSRAPLIFLPVTGKPAVRIYQCCHLKDKKAYPGHLARTVRRERNDTQHTHHIKGLHGNQNRNKG